MAFKLTENHLKLLKNMNVYFCENAYDGAPTVDEKRPYGNSGDQAYEVYRILYHKEYDWPDDREMDEELHDTLMTLHQETATALQIVLCTQSFEPGLYERESEYIYDSWKKIG